jgi:hypothetical protein
MASDVAYSRSLIGLALAASLCLPAWPSHAQPASQPRAAGTAASRPGPASGAIRVRPTTIEGGAWHANNTPIPQARLRLRSVVTGAVEATTQANEAGEFTFSEIAEGAYLVELVNERGKVLAVSQSFTIAPGETVATFVRLGPKVPWYNGFFGSAALAVTSTAAVAGVAAMAPGAVTSVSPNR